MEKNAEYFEKRIRAALETLQAMRALNAEKKQEDELFSKIMEKFLPNQTRYTEDDIKKAFSETEYKPPTNVGDALKIMTETVARGGIQIPEVKKTRRIEDMLMPSVYRTGAGVAA
jgi:hypothetical protein